MVFIDASFYLSLLNPKDSNHEKSIEMGKKHKGKDYVTTYMVLGEVLTVGSQRFDKFLTIEFVEEILGSKTKIVLEKADLVKRAFSIFKKIKSKNVSWVDCYSFAVMEKLKIKMFLSFDRHFKKFSPLK